MYWAVALKDLHLEEGTFWKGLKFLPGWYHNPLTHKPVSKLFGLLQVKRARELEYNSDVLLEYIPEQDTLAAINQKRAEVYSTWRSTVL